MELRTTSSYAAELRPALGKHVFRPAPLRLLWLLVHYMVIALGTLAIARDWLPLAPKLVVSVVMGASFAGLTFVAHEALHGALVRGRVLRRLVGRLGFLPFAVPPRLWEAWHNRVHHGSTNRPGIDPDTYPTLEEYNGSALLRHATDWLAPGRSRMAGVFSLLVGFSVQSSHMLFTAHGRGFLSRAQHRLALIEAAAAWLLWGLLALWLGPASFALAFGVPLLVSNVIIMSLILTNHNLSPQTAVNDPLVNSLSVSGPRFVEWLTLGFGFHVEHHLFPAMSGRYAREVSEEMRRRYPTRYQRLPYFRALLLLHRSPRVYRTDTLLFDPSKGLDWPTLTPRTEGTEPTPPPPTSPGMSASRTGAIALSLTASLACSAMPQRSPSATETLPPRASESEPAPDKAAVARPEDASEPINAHHPPPATTSAPDEPRDR